MAVQQLSDTSTLCLLVLGLFRKKHIFVAKPGILGFLILFGSFLYQEKY